MPGGFLDPFTSGLAGFGPPGGGPGLTGPVSGLLQNVFLAQRAKKQQEQERVLAEGALLEKVATSDSDPNARLEAKRMLQDLAGKHGKDKNASAAIEQFLTGHMLGSPSPAQQQPSGPTTNALVGGGIGGTTGPGPAQGLQPGAGQFGGPQMVDPSALTASPFGPRQAITPGTAPQATGPPPTNEQLTAMPTSQSLAGESQLNPQVQTPRRGVLGSILSGLAGVGRGVGEAFTGIPLGGQQPMNPLLAQQASLAMAQQTAQQLQQLGLTPEQAVEMAVTGKAGASTRGTRPTPQQELIDAETAAFTQLHGRPPNAVENAQIIRTSMTRATGQRNQFQQLREDMIDAFRAANHRDPTPQETTQIDESARAKSGSSGAGSLTGNLKNIAGIDELLEQYDPDAKPGEQGYMNPQLIGDLKTKREQLLAPPIGVTTLKERKQEAHSLAEQVKRGEGDVFFTGTPRDVKAMAEQELADSNFNIRNARFDQMATETFIRNMNSQQMLQIFSRIGFTNDAIDRISNPKDQTNDLIGQLKATKVALGKSPVVNKVELVAAMQGAYGPKAQSVATRLNQQISLVRLDIAALLTGSGSPTDKALDEAASVMQSDWSEKQMRDAVAQAKDNVSMREKSMVNLAPHLLNPQAQTPSAQSPTPTGGPNPSAATAAPAAAPSQTPAAGQLWASGPGGHLIISNDGGRTWQDQQTGQPVK